MMDLHLRAYFSHKSVQMEADAMVFGKIVEALQPQVAKRVFVDMGVPPLEVCRLWCAHYPLLHLHHNINIYISGSRHSLLRRSLKNMSTEFGTSAYVKVRVLINDFLVHRL